jgi:hypothetical protein
VEFELPVFFFMDCIKIRMTGLESRLPLRAACRNLFPDGRTYRFQLEQA